MASRCISTIYDQNSRDISPRRSRGLISREFWSYIVDIHQEAMVYIIIDSKGKGLETTFADNECELWPY